MKQTALIVALVICAPAYAQTYKCVDQRGVTHYSDKPLPNCKSEIIKIQRGGAAPMETASPRAAARTTQELQRQCARDMQEYSRLTPSRRDAGANDEVRQQRLEALREQLRGCS